MMMHLHLHEWNNLMVSEKGFFCHGRILTALSEKVCDIFCETKTSKELWEALETKYNCEEGSVKRCSVENFLDFIWFDGNPCLIKFMSENYLHDL